MKRQTGTGAFVPLVPLLRDILVGGQYIDRVRTLLAVRDIGPDCADLVPLLLEMLELGGEPRGLGPMAAEALASIGPDASQAIPQIVDYMLGRRQGLAVPECYAPLVLAGIGDQAALPALVEALDKGDESLTCNALAAIGQFGSGARSFAPRIIHVLQTGRQSERQAARSALCRIDPDNWPPVEPDA